MKHLSETLCILILTKWNEIKRNLSTMNTKDVCTLRAVHKKEGATRSFLTRVAAVVQCLQPSIAWHFVEQV